MDKAAALPIPRFKVRKKSGVDLWYVIHYSPDHLRWEAYENQSQSRVPLAKKYDDRTTAEAIAERLTRRHPWTDFDQQLFKHRAAGDQDWPFRSGDIQDAVAAVRARLDRP